MDLPNATQDDLQSQDNICIICREEMTFGETNKKLLCGHCFHLSCLRQWMERQQKCPTCRSDISLAASYQNRQNMGGNNGANQNNNNQNNGGGANNDNNNNNQGRNDNNQGNNNNNNRSLFARFIWNRNNNNNNRNNGHTNINRNRPFQFAFNFGFGQFQGRVQQMLQEEAQQENDRVQLRMRQNQARRQQIPSVMRPHIQAQLQQPLQQPLFNPPPSVNQQLNNQNTSQNQSSNLGAENTFISQVRSSQPNDSGPPVTSTLAPPSANIQPQSHIGNVSENDQNQARASGSYTQSNRQQGVGLQPGNTSIQQAAIQQQGQQQLLQGYNNILQNSIAQHNLLMQQLQHQQPQHMLMQKLHEIPRSYTPRTQHNNSQGISSDPQAQQQMQPQPFINPWNQQNPPQFGLLMNFPPIFPATSMSLFQNYHNQIQYAGQLLPDQFQYTMHNNNFQVQPAILNFTQTNHQQPVQVQASASSYLSTLQNSNSQSIGPMTFEQAQQQYNVQQQQNQGDPSSTINNEQLDKSKGSNLPQSSDYPTQLGFQESQHSSQIPTQQMLQQIYRSSPHSSAYIPFYSIPLVMPPSIPAAFPSLREANRRQSGQVQFTPQNTYGETKITPQPLINTVEQMVNDENHPVEQQQQQQQQQQKDDQQYPNSVQQDGTKVINMSRLPGEASLDVQQLSSSHQSSGIQTPLDSQLSGQQQYKYIQQQEELPKGIDPSVAPYKDTENKIQNTSASRQASPGRLNQEGTNPETLNLDQQKQTQQDARQSGEFKQDRTQEIDLRYANDKIAEQSKVLDSLIKQSTQQAQQSPLKALAKNQKQSSTQNQQQEIIRNQLNHQIASAAAAAAAAAVQFPGYFHPTLVMPQQNYVSMSQDQTTSQSLGNSTVSDPLQQQGKPVALEETVMQSQEQANNIHSVLQGNRDNQQAGQNINNLLSRAIDDVASTQQSPFISESIWPQSQTPEGQSFPSPQISRDLSPTQKTARQPDLLSQQLQDLNKGVDKFVIESQKNSSELVVQSRQQNQDQNYQPQQPEQLRNYETAGQNLSHASQYLEQSHNYQQQQQQDQQFFSNNQTSAAAVAASAAAQSILQSQMDILQYQMNNLRSQQDQVSRILPTLSFSQPQSQMEMDQNYSSVETKISDQAKNPAVPSLQNESNPDNQIFDNNVKEKLSENFTQNSQDNLKQAHQAATKNVSQ